MLTPAEVDSYARSLVVALRSIGSAPRGEVHGMPTRLNLAPHEAEAVVHYAITERMLVADGEGVRAAGE
jgi:hypothetical protein